MPDVVTRVEMDGVKDTVFEMRLYVSRRPIDTKRLWKLAEDAIAMLPREQSRGGCSNHVTPFGRCLHWVEPKTFKVQKSPVSFTGRCDRHRETTYPIGSSPHRNLIRRMTIHNEPSLN